MTVVADPKILEQNEMEKMTANGAVERSSFFWRGQFCGFSGSLGPSHVTRSREVEITSGSLGGDCVPGVKTPFGRAIKLTWTVWFLVGFRFSAGVKPMVEMG